MRYQSVDTTEIIRHRFWEAKNGYEKAKKRGAIKEAIQKAEDCSEYLRLLAEAVPFESGHYSELASKYDLEIERLKRIKQRVPEKKGLPERPSGVKSEIRRMDEEFENEARMLKMKKDVRWDDIAGLEGVKKLLREIVFYCVAPPPTNVKLSPPRTILLYGPPGCGKTMLAQAASSNLGATFFNAPIDKLLSRYVGDSPRLVSSLFRVAAEDAPSVVFLDEIEVLVGRREEMKDLAMGVVQTFLSELDGFESKMREFVILTMAATNKPWMIDEAILDKFLRRIYVPLPDTRAREQILRLNLEKKGFSVEANNKKLAMLTEGYNGRNIMNTCTSAIWAMLRRANPEAHELVGGDAELTRSAKYKVLPITKEEILDAISRVKPIVGGDTLRRYEQWRSRYGIEY